MWRCSGVGLLPEVVGGKVAETVIFLSDRFEEDAVVVVAEPGVHYPVAVAAKEHSRSDGKVQQAVLLHGQQG